MRNFERLCKDYQDIENFEKAAAENFKDWNCHHRLETHTSDGERRAVDITAAELQALGMYYDRPASELIFLTVSEHSRLHMKGKHRSEETKNKISKAAKGRQFSKETKKKIREALKGHTVSAEARNKISEAAKGSKRSEETRKKISKAKKGRKRSEETRNKISEAMKGNTATKGMRWFNNGKINKRCYECPVGFIPGQLRR